MDNKHITAILDHTLLFIPVRVTRLRKCFFHNHNSYNKNIILQSSNLTCKTLLYFELPYEARQTVQEVALKFISFRHVISWSKVLKAELPHPVYAYSICIASHFQRAVTMFVTSKVNSSRPQCNQGDRIGRFIDKKVTKQD